MALKSKELFFVIITVLLSLLIKLGGVNYHLYDDEAIYASATVTAGSFGFNQIRYTPILMQWLQLFFTSVLGIKIWVLRLVPLIFGILTMLLAYQLTKEKFSLKAARITLLIMAFSFYPILASLQLDTEGSLLTFFYLLSVYSFLKLESGEGVKWKIICGVSLFFSLLAKHNAILIFMVLSFYVLIKEKASLNKTLKRLFTPFLIGLGGYVIFLVFAYLVNPKNLFFMFRHGSQFFTGLHFSSIAPLILLFWATPFLIGLAFLAVYYCKYLEGQKSLIFYVWLGIMLLFYIFIIEWGDYSRYFSNLVPVMAILGGNLLSRFNFKPKNFICGGVFFFLFLFSFFWLNTLPQKLVPRFFGSYLKEILSFNFNFLFSYTTSSGPTLGISFIIILFAFILSFLCAALFIVFKGRKKAKFFLIIFLSIGAAYNIFLVSEFIFHPTSPDVSFVQYQVVDYFKEKKLPFPLFSNDEGILFDADHSYLLSNQVIGLADNELGASVKEQIKRIKKEGGTVLLLHWPPLPEESPAWEVVNYCRLEKQFYSKGVLVGEVYSC